NKTIWPSVGAEHASRADNAVSKNKTDDEIGPSTVTPFTSFRASSERSEGSVALGREMLRCAQQDSAVTHTASWINLLKCIIGPRWIFRHPDEKVKLHYRVPTRLLAASTAS